MEPTTTPAPGPVTTSAPVLPPAPTPTTPVPTETVDLLRAEIDRLWDIACDSSRTFRERLAAARRAAELSLVLEGLLMTEYKARSRIPGQPE